MNQPQNIPFYIQCGHPVIRDVEPREFELLADIFPHLFCENEESFYLIWNQIPIRFHYTYELYKNINEIVGLCWLLQKDDQGELTATFMQEQVFMDWKISWENNQITIHSSFLSRFNSYDQYATLLNENATITLPLSAFLSEWKALLMQIGKSIQVSGFTIEDGIERRRFETLLRGEKKIHGLGILYRNEFLEA